MRVLSQMELNRLSRTKLMALLSNRRGTAQLAGRLS
jgi:hypothetical protein